jgi:hypothetical protein
MPNLEDFVSKKKDTSVRDSKKQRLEGSFQCNECNTYSEYAMIDENLAMEWECQNGHISYGRL